MRALAASLLVDTCTLAYRAAQAWATTLPLGLDLIRVRRTFDTAALAAAFPFDSPQLPAADPIRAAHPEGCSTAATSPTENDLITTSPEFLASVENPDENFPMVEVA